jgi:hypothetical protein
MNIHNIKDCTRETYFGIGFEKHLPSYLKKNNKKIKDVSSEEFDLICDLYLNPYMMEHKPIIMFLETNGFKQVNDYTWENDKCTVQLLDFQYIVTDKTPDPGTMFSDNLSIYWLIGVLTYRNLMDRNYKDDYHCKCKHPDTGEGNRTICATCHCQIG